MNIVEREEIVRELLKINSQTIENFGEQQHRLLENALSEIFRLRLDLRIMTSDRDDTLRRLNTMKEVVNKI